MLEHMSTIMKGSIGDEKSSHCNSNKDQKLKEPEPEKHEQESSIEQPCLNVNNRVM